MMSLQTSEMMYSEEEVAEMIESVRREEIDNVAKQVSWTLQYVYIF